MADSFALEHLSEGQSAYVTLVAVEPAMRRRLADLGLIRGTRVTCLYRSPAGDPVAYLIRGAVIALRGQDTSRIQVRPVPSMISPTTAEVPASWA